MWLKICCNCEKRNECKKYENELYCCEKFEYAEDLEDIEDRELELL